MGPVILLDKSAFQSLSRREMTAISWHFFHNVSPILVYEVLGDLSKKAARGRQPQDVVRDLARKLVGTSSVVQMHYNILATQALYGAKIPLTGQAIPGNSRRSTDGQGLLVDMTTLDWALLRWSEGRFTENEEQLSKLWRSVTRKVSFSGLREVLRRNYVIIPSSDREHIGEITDSLTQDPSLQLVWRDWLLDQFVPDSSTRHAIRRRWQSLDADSVESFAPFAYHCLRVTISLLVAIGNHHIGWKPTHLLDLQYLYYSPFAMIFVSDDRLHRLLYPQLKHDNQIFLRGVELKRELREIVDIQDSFDRPQLGEPPETTSGLLNDVWNSGTTFLGPSGLYG